MRALHLHLLVNRNYTFNHNIMPPLITLWSRASEFKIYDPIVMLYQATIVAACCILTHSSTFYDKHCYHTWKWHLVKAFQNIPNSFATCLVPGLHFPLSQSSSKFHNEIQWKHTAYLKRSFSLELAILLKFRLLCRMLSRYGEEKSIRHFAIVAKFLDDNKPRRELSGSTKKRKTFCTQVFFKLSVRMQKGEKQGKARQNVLW